MDRREQIPKPRPRVHGFTCPECESERQRLGAVNVYSFYLHCDACGHVWSRTERRKTLARRPPLKRPS